MAAETVNPATEIRPPFTEETARAKVKASEDAWNSGDPERVALEHSEDCQWRVRDEFFQGREAIKEFVRRKLANELDYKVMMELWAYTDNRIAVRFEYESQDQQGHWYRTHGNVLREFGDDGLQVRHDLSLTDIPIDESARQL